MNERREVARRLAGFAGLPLISLAGPFLLLPLIARVGGVEGWAAIAIGQAVGGLGGLVAGLGWGLVGPAAVAGATPDGRRRLYNESLESRLLALGVTVPVCALVAAILSAPQELWTAALMSIATTAGALSPGWYSIGIAKPSAIARYEIAPRLTATALSALLVFGLREVWVYPALLLAGTVVGTLLFGRHVAKTRLADLRPANAPRALWRTRSASTTVVVGGAFTSTPVLIAGTLVSVVVLAQYGSADRLYRFGLIGVTVLTNALQGWVAESRTPGVERLTRRMRYAVAAHVLVGVAGCLFLAVLGRAATQLLFGAAVAADPAVLTFMGVAFVAVSINSAAGRLVLIPHGASRQVLIATVAGAIFGLSAMVALGIAAGAVGVAGGFALSELTVMVVQIAAIARIRVSLLRADIGGSATASMPEGA